MEKYYKNLGFYFLSPELFVALGFYYPYFSLFPRFESVTTIIHISAITLMLWVFILIAQPILIRHNKFQLHRKLGRFTYVILPLVIFSSIAVVRKQYLEGLEAGKSPTLSFETVFTSFCSLFTIPFYYGAAIFYILRRNTAMHMRFMICLFLEFIPPTFGRILGYWFNIRQFYTYNASILMATLNLLFLIRADKKRNQNFKPYLVALSLYLLVNVAWYAMGHPI
jgi:hypothetical protein